MTRQGCPYCDVRTTDDGRKHHAPDCPEMRWPSGQRRGTMTPEQLAAVASLPAFRMTWQEEVAAIFEGKK